MKYEVFEGKCDSLSFLDTVAVFKLIIRRVPFNLDVKGIRCFLFV